MLSSSVPARNGAGPAVAAAICLAVPAAVLTVPNAVAFVADPALAELGGGPVGLVQAAGAALPALVLTVPAAAVLARMRPPGLLLAVGLAAVLLGGLLAGQATTIWALGAARALAGCGAGLALAAAAALAARLRSPLPSAVFAGALVAGLLLAMPAVLRAVPDRPEAWRDPLTGHPWVAAAALLAALPLLALRVTRGRPPLPAAERAQLTLPLVPAAGLVFLAVLAVERAWAPGVNLIVAALGVAALAGMALAAGRDTSGPLAPGPVLLLVGLLVLPVTAPLAGLTATARGLGGDELWPFGAAAFAALAAAIATVPLDARGARTAVGAGCALMVAGTGLLLAYDPLAGGPLLGPALVSLAGGAGLALAASLRDAPPGAFGFGLALCFPALLSGSLIAGSLQLARLGHVGSGDGPLDSLASAQRAWTATALILAVAATCLLPAARTMARARAPHEHVPRTRTPARPVSGTASGRARHR
ncbi:hypothetical protein [Actinocorallia sp. A-T 12471]|uniref:hypothetical protein n=1 Tax=Actinocorallia sp. A-T 12471 TaxID=3089813 RepID=UPI0029D217A1|nr:hypothetical protein [Actinocorallia sp. A-T 12471]MDX6742954.1 hypothetical protein [Actinocorallia sp. A-T 12471]